MQNVYIMPYVLPNGYVLSSEERVRLNKVITGLNLTKEEAQALVDAYSELTEELGRNVRAKAVPYLLFWIYLSVTVTNVLILILT